jgi:hypothetical protein
MGHHDRRALAAAQTVFSPRKEYRWTSRRSFAVVLAIASGFGVLLLTASARCEELAPVENRRAIIEHDGESGIWFRLDVARTMLADLEELPLIRLELESFAERLTIRDGQVERLRASVELAQEGERVAVEALQSALYAREETVRAYDVWWRSPALWAVVGAVVAAGVVTLTAYIYGQLGVE